MATTPTKPTYPRPDFKRPALSWLSLNGPWNFSFDDKNIGLKEKWFSQSSLPNARSITVPFAFQTAASGIHDPGAHEFIWYSRSLPTLLSASALAKGDRVLVRFGAVDYECAAWVGGVPVGRHRGGHMPFDVDVTDALP